MGEKLTKSDVAKIEEEINYRLERLHKKQVTADMKLQQGLISRRSLSQVEA